MVDMLDGPGVLVGKESKEKLPELYPHRPHIELQIEGAEAVAQRYYEAWQKEKIMLEDNKQFAVEHHQSLADNHWKPEREARLKYELALRVVKTMKETR